MNDINISTIQEDPSWSITAHRAGLPIEPKKKKKKKKKQAADAASAFERTRTSTMLA
jgi:hypothetical protein